MTTYGCERLAFKHSMALNLMGTSLTSGTLTSLPGRYAKALFDLAREQGQLKDVGTGLRSLEKLTQSSKILKQALSNPTLQREAQAAALMDICALIKAPKIIQSFAGQLVRANRIPYLPKIEKIYQALVSQAKGEKRVTITSAYPLTSPQREMLEGTLAKVFSEALNVTFANDPKILGGVRVQVGSQVVDATLVTQLNQLATVMKGNL